MELYAFYYPGALAENMRTSPYLLQQKASPVRVPCSLTKPAEYTLGRNRDHLYGKYIRASQASGHKKAVCTRSRPLAFLNHALKLGLITAWQDCQPW